jgi:hypothetical protein
VDSKEKQPGAAALDDELAERLSTVTEGLVTRAASAEEARS